MYTPDPSGWAVHVQSRPPKTLRGIRLPVTHARDSRCGSIFRRRTTSLFAPPEGSASLGGHTLAPAAPGSAAAHRTPPHSPTSQRRLVPSPELSPESRRIRNRMRVKGQESKFRTPQQRGELDMHLPQKKRGEHKRSQRRNGPNRGRVRRHPRPRAHLHDLRRGADEDRAHGAPDRAHAQPPVSLLGGWRRQADLAPPLRGKRQHRRSSRMGATIHRRDSRYGSIFRRRTTSLFAPPEGSASLGGHTLAPAAPGSAAAHRTPPHSPTSQRRLVPSPELSPESRRIRNRMRVKGQESKFRTPQQRGELDMHLPQKKRGEHKRSQRRNGPNRGRVRRHPRPRAHLHDLRRGADEDRAHGAPDRAHAQPPVSLLGGWRRQRGGKPGGRDAEARVPRDVQPAALRPIPRDAARRGTQEGHRGAEYDAYHRVATLSNSMGSLILAAQRADEEEGLRGVFDDPELLTIPGFW